MANNGIEDTFLYRSTDVARYLVFLANERKITVNMTKVQKLLYITCYFRQINLGVLLLHYYCDFRSRVIYGGNSTFIFGRSS